MTGILCIVIASDPLKPHFLLAAHPSNDLFKEMQLYPKEVSLCSAQLLLLSSSHLLLWNTCQQYHSLLEMISFFRQFFVSFAILTNMAYSPCLFFILTCKERCLVIPLSSEDFLSALNCFFPNFSKHLYRMKHFTYVLNILCLKEILSKTGLNLKFFFLISKLFLLIHVFIYYFSNSGFWYSSH